MTRVFEKNAHKLPINPADIATAWKAEGFSFGIFRDPPGQEWNGFVHDTDEYVLVAEGTLIIDVGDQSATCGAGDLVRIPRGAVHSLKTVSPAGSVWFYGYGIWGAGNGK
jgi:cupin 2 domain-containing protein